MVTESDGARAVAIARGALAACVGPTPPRDPAAPFRDRALPPLFDEKRGVFVTLRTAEAAELRGCIGYPLPVLPLRAGIPRAAVAAAVEDPRFPPVHARELAAVTVEVSVLTSPQPVASVVPSERLAAVVVGRDGLLIEGRGTSGLLLPQVAVEQAWDPAQFLAELCRKAGLRAEMWRSSEVRLSTFQADVFAEERPEGAVARVPLGSR